MQEASVLRPRPSHPDPRAALHQKNFCIIVSIAGAEVVTTRAIENKPDDSIEKRLYGLAIQRSVQESKRFGGFIDTFGEIKSRRQKKGQCVKMWLTFDTVWL